MKRIQTTTILPVVISCLVLGHAVTASAQGSRSRAEEEAIRKVIAGTTDAFNRHDAKAFARFYTSDAELVTVRGERMKGVAEIEKGLAAIFATRAKTATLKTLDITIRFIKPDVAVAHVINEMSGVVNGVGVESPPHRELSIRVFVKDKGAWRVSAFHNTVISPSRAAAPETNSAPVRAEVRGVWKVTELASRAPGAEWEVRTTPYLSQYIFTEKHYSYMYVPGAGPRKLFAGDPNRPTDAEKAEAYNSLVAASGTYTLSGSTLTLTALVHKNPNEMVGKPLTYTVEIDGNTLRMLIVNPPFLPGREWRTVLTKVE